MDSTATSMVPAPAASTATSGRCACDYTLNERMHAFGRFSRFTDTLTGKTEFGAAGGRGFGIGGYAGTSKGANDSLASGMDIALKPTLLTDFRLAYYRYNIKTSKFDQDVAIRRSARYPWSEHRRLLHRRFAGL